MKTVAEPSAINPAILAMTLLAAGLVYLTASGLKLPLLSNLKVNLAVLIVLGMAMCTQGGIGRIAATGQWAHPLAIAGYILGGSILILAACIFFNIPLPFIASQQQAFLIVAALIAAKIVNAVAHYYLFGQR